MKTYPKVITEICIATSEHVRYFQLDLPVALGAGYKQVVSYSSFFHSLKRKNCSKTNLYHTEDLIYALKWNKDLMKEKPLIKVVNIWEFYKLIGYDYKRKKWGPIPQ